MRVRGFLAVSLCLASAPFASAQLDSDGGWASRDYEYATSSLDDFTDRFADDLVDPVARRIREGGQATTKAPASKAKTAPAPTTFKPVPVAVGQTVAHRMAAAYPVKARAAAEDLFDTLLETHGEVQAQLGVPPNDLAGALASFIAGNWMAMNNVPFPDKNFQPLVRQMRSILETSPEFSGLTNAERQEIFQNLAINGMFMAAAQARLEDHPDRAFEASMRAAGRSNLEEWLSADPSGLRITAKGLEFAP